MPRRLWCGVAAGRSAPQSAAQIPRACVLRRAGPGGTPSGPDPRSSARTSRGARTFRCGPEARTAWGSGRSATALCSAVLILTSTLQGLFGAFGRGCLLGAACLVPLRLAAPRGTHDLSRDRAARGQAEVLVQQKAILSKNPRSSWRVDSSYTDSRRCGGSPATPWLVPTRPVE